MIKHGVLGGSPAKEGTENGELSRPELPLQPLPGTREGVSCTNYCVIAMFFATIKELINY